MASIWSPWVWNNLVLIFHLILLQVLILLCSHSLWLLWLYSDLSTWIWSSGRQRDGNMLMFCEIRWWMTWKFAKPNLLFLFLVNIGIHRYVRKAFSGLSNPLIVNTLVGTLSAIEILSVTLFAIFLAWTYYTRLSNDFKQLMPVKTLKLETWV